MSETSIEESFKQEFQALLKKYNAEIQVDDFWQGYSECGSDVRAEIYIPAGWDKEGNLISKSECFDLV